jgi:hypothetical protein
MSRDFSYRKIFLGIAAGLLSTIGGLILAYLRFDSWRINQPVLSVAESGMREQRTG